MTQLLDEAAAGRYALKEPGRPTPRENLLDQTGDAATSRRAANGRSMIDTNALM